ncbi:hypothetical protein [Anthocerotibacter panamensis]|uniref:hypothetical protein n=1 Tax=Anthocerotibacter panamensis TaxID=2857077 RepID=UPI001C4039CD|nr:hypothetical protein [Anthocerotibacter panamensis]
MGKGVRLSKRQSRPWLLTLVLGSALSALFAAPRAKAADVFGNAGIRFEVDTIVEFEFVRSHGAYQSTFGVEDVETRQKTPLLAEVKPSDTAGNPCVPYNSQDDSTKTTEIDFLGTPGNTVPKFLTEFAFKANKRYRFYLESTYNYGNCPVSTVSTGGKSAQTRYSDGVNINGQFNLKFDKNFPGLSAGGAVLRWDDSNDIVPRTSEDHDFDDFIVVAGGTEACPYP